MKVTKIGERVIVKFQADALNVFNQPSFDVPVNNISQYSVTEWRARLRTPPATFGFIQHTLGRAADDAVRHAHQLLT